MTSADDRRPGLDIQLDAVSLHRDRRAVLRDIRWTLREGERWVLLGRNGAGKTQLLKLLEGSIWPDPDSRGRRRYRLGGEPLPLMEARDHLAYLGPERQDRYERRGWDFKALDVVCTGLLRCETPYDGTEAISDGLRRRGRTFLRAVSMGGFASKRLLETSLGERRLILLARALATLPRWLLLDELSTGLDEESRRRVSAWFSGHGGSWVLTTHRTEEIPASATHLAVIDGGRLLHAAPLERSRRGLPRIPHFPDTTAARKARVASRRRAPPRPPPHPGAPAAPLVAVERADVYLAYRPVLRRISFEVRSGECWVVHGASGSGKSTLLRAIHGEHPVASGGRIVRQGIDRGVPLEQFRRWCALVAPHLQADPPRETVLDAVVSGLRCCIGLHDTPTPTERRLALAALERFGLAHCSSKLFHTLSYGQARKALLARAWVTSPRLLLFDEALAGIDAGARQELLGLIERFVDDGGAVVFATHHRDEWPHNATHEIELVEGRSRYAGRLRRRPSRGDGRG